MGRLEPLSLSPEPKPYGPGLLGPRLARSPSRLGVEARGTVWAAAPQPRAQGTQESG